MPRPKKKSELVLIPLDVASGKISKVMEILNPPTLMRIRQALDRHPDLKNLLEPIEKELAEQVTQLRSAKAAVSTAKSLVRNLEK